MWMLHWVSSSQLLGSENSNLGPGLELLVLSDGLTKLAKTRSEHSQTEHTMAEPLPISDHHDMHNSTSRPLKPGGSWGAESRVVVQHMLTLSRIWFGTSQ